MTELTDTERRSGWVAWFQARAPLLADGQYWASRERGYHEVAYFKKDDGWEWQGSGSDVVPRCIYPVRVECPLHFFAPHAITTSVGYDANGSPTEEWA